MKKSLKKKQLIMLLGPLLFCNNSVLAAEYTGSSTIYGSGFDDYDRITINTSESGGIAPLAGYGLYNVTGTLKAVSITTSGSKADALMLRSSSNLTIGDNLNIIATGSSADGINVAITGSSLLKVGNDAEISVAKGVGVRANLSIGGGNNSIIIGDNLKVTTAGNGSNITDAEGYAVYAGNRDYETVNMPAAGSAIISIGDGSSLTTSGTSAHAVYANKTGYITLKSTNITTTGKGAHGLYAANGDITPNYSFSCIFGGCPKTSLTGGKITLFGDTQITVNTDYDGTSQQSYAIYSSGSDSLIASAGDLNGSVNQNIYTITGDMKADNAGTITLTMNDGSIFNGNTTVDDVSNLDLRIAGTNSQWNMSKSSSLSYLDLDGATVSIGKQTDFLDGSNDITLTVDELLGNGIFNMRTTIDGINNHHDLLKVTESNMASGNHTIVINDSNTGGTTVDGSERVQLVQTEGGDAVFTGTTDVGGYIYKLGQGDATLGERDSDWYLTSKKKDSGGGENSNTGDNSANIASINYLMNYIENQTLLQRMGELRNTSNQTGDAWGRVYSGYIDSFDNHNLKDKKLRYSGFQLGADKNIDSTELWDIYIGVVAGMSKGMTDFNVGDGSTTSYYAGIYGTYKEYNGFYLDFMAKYMYMDNKFNTTTSGGYAVNGSGHSNGLAVSLEGGKRFWLNGKPTIDAGSWFIEPQGQFTYGYQGSSSIDSSNGLKTELSQFNSFLGRVSTLFGYTTYDQKQNQVDVYAKFGYVKEYDGDTSYQFNQGIKESYSFKGHWIDMGLGVNAQIAGHHNIYADLNYATGDAFNIRQVNIGYRYNF